MSGEKSQKQLTMQRQLSTIMDIQPAMKNRWTVLVQVVEPGHMQTSKAGSNFRRLLFTDSQGTMTAAVIYAAHIKFFLKTFRPYKRYYISNCVVTKADIRFLVSSYPHSWTLNNRTLVEEHIEPIPPILPCTFEFTRFTELAKHMETDTLQNIQAIVVKSFPAEEQEQGSGITTKQDIVVVNKEKHPMILTLWNFFAETEGQILDKLIDPPAMIFGLRLKVTSFNGLSLTTRNGSGILINPPVPEDLQLNNWYNETRDEIENLINQKAFRNMDLLLPPPVQADIMPITTYLATQKTAWITGRITVQPQDRSYTQTGCANCLKPLEADLTWIVQCPSCKTECEVELIVRVAVQIDDGTATIKTILTSPIVEKFITTTSSQIRNAEEAGQNIQDIVEKELNDQTIIAFARDATRVIFRVNNQRNIQTEYILIFKAVSYSK